MRIWLGSSTKRTSFKYFEKKINPSSDPSILNGNVHLLGYREKMPSTCIFSHLSLIYSFSSSPPFSSSLPFNFLYFLSCIVSHFFSNPFIFLNLSSYKHWLTIKPSAWHQKYNDEQDTAAWARWWHKIYKE